MANPLNLMRSNQTRMAVAAAVFLITGYGTHVLVARAFGPEDYGRVGLAISLLTATNFLFTGGISAAVSRGALTAPDRALALSASGTISLMLGAAGGALLVAIGLATLGSDSEGGRLILLAALAIPGYAAFSFSQGVLNASDAIPLQAWSAVAGYIFRFGMVVAAALLIASTQLVVLAYAVGCIVSAAIAAAGFPRFSVRLWLPPAPELFRASVAVITNTILNLWLFCLMNGDLLVLGFLFPGDPRYGLYLAAATLARVPFYFGSSVATALLPAEATPAFDSKPLHRASVRTLGLVVGFSLVWAVLVAAFGDFALERVFGFPFGTETGLWPPLAIGGAVLGILGAGSTLLFARHRTRPLNVMFPGVALAMAAIVWLSSDLGFSYAAWASVAAVLAGLVVVAWAGAGIVSINKGLISVGRRLDEGRKR